MSHTKAQNERISQPLDSTCCAVAFQLITNINKMRKLPTNCRAFIIFAFISNKQYGRINHVSGSLLQALDQLPADLLDTTSFMTQLFQILCILHLNLLLQHY